MEQREVITRCIIFDTIVLGLVWGGFFGSSQKLFYGILAGLITLVLVSINYLLIKK